MANHHYDDESYVFVVDREGHLIYHPDSERLGENVRANEVVEKVINEDKGSQIVMNTRGNEFFASYSYLEVADWGIVVQTPTSIIKAPLQRLFWRIVLLTLPFLIVILLISGTIVSTITRPINELAQFSEKALKGNSDDLRLRTRNSYSLVYEVRQLFQQISSHLEMLNKQATVDGLTQLANRRKTMNVLKDWIEDHKDFSLILIDIDFFKKVNDQYGHLKGDEVLQYLAQEMEKVCGDKGLCFRYGGEEFGILLNPMSEQEAFEVAEQLRKQIAETISPTGKPIYISLGVTSSEKEDRVPEDMIERADIALYHSKETGRNRTTIYSKDLHS